MDKQAIEQHWTDLANQLLAGKKIARVEIMPQYVADEMGWGYRPLCLVLDDETIITPQADDEGNEAGALYVMPNKGDGQTLPVMRGGIR